MQLSLDIKYTQFYRLVGRGHVLPRMSLDLTALAPRVMGPLKRQYPDPKEALMAQVKVCVF